MGDPAAPFRGMGHSHFEMGDFNFSACASELGGFNFDMGNARSNATEDSASVNHGVEAFFELSDAAKAFCVAGYGAQRGEAGDDEESVDDVMIGWVSPRISFSQDLPMEEPEAQKTSRAFPEKRKRQGGAGNGELNDGYSSEFEFLSNGVANADVVRQTKDMMLSADELFSDGKLRPIHAQEMASLDMRGSKPSLFHVSQTAESRDNEPGVLSCKLTLQDSRAHESNAAEVHEKLMARHLSLDLPRPNSSSTICGLAPLVSVSVDNSPCSSPPRSSAPAPNSRIATSSSSTSSSLSTSPPAQHKPGSKYTSKIKDFFKPKRISSSTAATIPQLTRDNSITSTSTCRIPIPPRSFWPFSRSNSAGESKTALPSLPPRSNSAGESNASRVSKKSNEAGVLELNKNSCISHGQAAMASANEDESHNNGKDCTDVASSSNHTETAKQENTEEECVPGTSSGQQVQKRSIGNQKGKASGSPARAARRRYMYTTANFLRGSPGRRGGMSPPVKANAGRIVLRNLERCSADRKLCRETSGKRVVAYPVALRVSPVINVALYRGKVPSSGMFGLRNLFTSKKEKVKEKDAAINNWRAGA